MTTRSIRSVYLAASALVLVACGSRTPETGIAGSYGPDGAAFLSAGTDALVASGRVAEEHRDMARSMLEKVQFDLDLRPDGTFRASMGVPGTVHVYRGRWTRTGSSVRLDQTHEDDVEVSDVMTGRIDGQVLHLQHEEEGMTMPYILRRGSDAATPSK